MVFCLFSTPPYFNLSSQSCSTPNDVFTLEKTSKFLPKHWNYEKISSITCHSFEFQLRCWESKPNYSGLFQYQIEFKVKIELLPNILRDIHEFRLQEEVYFFSFLTSLPTFGKTWKLPIQQIRLFATKICQSNFILFKSEILAATKKIWFKLHTGANFIICSKIDFGIFATLKQIARKFKYLN